MIQILVNDKKHQLITSWSEMNKKQFYKICHIYLNYLISGTVEEYNSVRIQCFYVLSDMPLKILKNITANEWVDLLDYVDFVFKEAPSIETNLVPSIRLGLFRKKLYGPVGMLDNITLFELMEADTAFLAASNMKNFDKLYNLAAILYRPKRKGLRKFKNSVDWNNDIREKYNQIQAENRVDKMRKLPLYKLVAIFIHFWSFRENHLVNSPIFEPIFKGKEQNFGLTIGWLGTLFAVSDSTFGNLDQTKDQNWKLVMVKLTNDLTVKENMDKKAEENRIRASFKN